MKELTPISFYQKKGGGEREKALNNLLLDVSTKFAQNIINKLDRDKDGCITLEEWTTVGAKTPALLNLLMSISFDDLK